MVHHYSTISTLNSIKWKKRLSKILYHWNAPPTSATANAAATEKFARHSSDDYYIHSEDLTASQFANLTGIKTKRNSATHSIFDYIDSEVDDSEDEELEEEDYYSIWDSKFWENTSKSITRVQSEPIRPMIQKGRFKIMWGEEEEALKPTEAIIKPLCVEWKRKRTSSK